MTIISPEHGALPCMSICITVSVSLDDFRYVVHAHCVVHSCDHVRCCWQWWSSKSELRGFEFWTVESISIPFDLCLMLLLYLLKCESIYCVLFYLRNPIFGYWHCDRWGDSNRHFFVHGMCSTDVRSDFEFQCHVSDVRLQCPAWWFFSFISIPHVQCTSGIEMKKNRRTFPFSGSQQVCWKRAVCFDIWL